MMCKEKRDQRSYEIVQKYRSGVFLKVLAKIRDPGNYVHLPRLNNQF